jgi:hypothetical protein
MKDDDLDNLFATPLKDLVVNMFQIVRAVFSTICLRL